MLEALQNGRFLERLQLDSTCYHVIHANDAMIRKHLLQQTMCIDALLTKKALTLLAESHCCIFITVLTCDLLVLCYLPQQLWNVTQISQEILIWEVGDPILRDLGKAFADRALHHVTILIRLTRKNFQTGLTEHVQAREAFGLGEVLMANRTVQLLFHNLKSIQCSGDLLCHENS